MRQLAINALRGLKIGDTVTYEKNGKPIHGKVTLVHGEQFEVRWSNGASGSFTLGQAVDSGISGPKTI
jgi:ribosomal protein L35AE/L33A